PDEEGPDADEGEQQTNAGRLGVGCQPHGNLIWRAERRIRQPCGIRKVGLKYDYREWERESQEKLIFHTSPTRQRGYCLPRWRVGLVGKTKTGALLWQRSRSMLVQN